jgi:phenylacetyl-CoA:acceptor oxidoreductase subunit 2
MSDALAPQLQRSWDWRAAANFCAGGAGSGLAVFAAAAGAPALLGAGTLLVALGLAAVWCELGRPWRALNVFLRPRRSWMSREALVAPALFAAAPAALLGVPHAAWLAALFALAFVWCQGRILRAAKGIPAWREPMLVPLVVATGLAEGGGLFLLLAPGAMQPWLADAWVYALLARLGLWFGWRARVAEGAPRQALAAIDRERGALVASTLLPFLVAVLAALDVPGFGVQPALLAAAGALACAGGWWFKFTLITRAAFNQGFALWQLPVRGVRRIGRRA